MQTLVSKLDKRHPVALSFFNIQSHIRGNGTTSRKRFNDKTLIYGLHGYAIMITAIERSWNRILCMLKYI